MAVAVAVVVAVVVVVAAVAAAVVAAVVAVVVVVAAVVAAVVLQRSGTPWLLPWLHPILGGPPSQAPTPLRAWRGRSLRPSDPPAPLRSPRSWCPLSPPRTWLRSARCPVGVQCPPLLGTVPGRSKARTAAVGPAARRLVRQLQHLAPQVAPRTARQSEDGEPLLQVIV